MRISDWSSDVCSSDLPAGFLTMEKVRHQLFLPRPLSDRLEALASRPGTTKSAILVDALTAWLNRRGASELEDRFAIRLERLTQAIGRVADRKSGGEGKSVSVRVGIGGRRRIKKQQINI